MLFKLKEKNIRLVLLLLVLTLMVGCSGSTEADNAEIPDLKVAYVFTNHQTPLMVAASRAEAFEADGTWLKTVIEREQYVLMEGDAPIANIDLIVNKNGSETMTMMTQGHVDLALASSAAFISAVDKGAELKMLCPVHTEGIGLVMAQDADVDNWEAFAAMTREADAPVMVGYHSPTSAPVILFAAALDDAGLSYTKNPDDVTADILLVDLKGTNNLLPALTSKQVEAWVGPSPYPELAVTEGVGKMVLDLREMPPAGKWHDFPCCVAGATQETIDNHGEAVEAFTRLLTVAADYAANHPEEAAQITSDFTGVSLEAARMSAIKYTTNPSETWVTNLGLVYDVLHESDSLNEQFADKTYEETHDDIFNFSFIRSILGQ
ncbi:ABC transporter substrate-binding protein [Anoxynatronum sibiricum]|uniref:ABC transporter substrate-binding protein n=1 Tax=Anoxynatronum sibiricum TaxID=210623 RepID=A0ABU9VTR4_9CLOT